MKIVCLIAIMLGVFAGVGEACNDFSSSSEMARNESLVEERVSALEEKRANETTRQRSKNMDMESRLKKVEKDLESYGLAFFGAGVLCALWAQYTRRSSWLWFFLGAFLAPIALVAMLWKNAEDLKRGRVRYWTRDAS